MTRKFGFSPKNLPSIFVSLFLCLRRVPLCKLPSHCPAQLPKDIFGKIWRHKIIKFYFYHLVHQRELELLRNPHRQKFCISRAESENFKITQIDQNCLMLVLIVNANYFCKASIEKEGQKALLSCAEQLK